jgi:hypothetical protein
MLSIVLGEKGVYGNEQTVGMTAVWRLFVHGKKVYGNPDRFHVNISNREAKIFSMIADTYYHQKRKIWYDYVDGKIGKKEMLKRLEEVLPKCLLAQKLLS